MNFNTGGNDPSQADEHQLYLQQRLWQSAISREFTNLCFVCQDGSSLSAHMAVLLLGDNRPASLLRGADTVILPDYTNEEVSMALKSFYLERNSGLLESILGTSPVATSQQPTLQPISTLSLNANKKESRKKIRRPKMSVSAKKIRSSRIACDICGLFVSKLKEHLIRKHPESLEPSQATVFQCQECDYSTRIRSTLKQHIYNLHAEKVFQCNSCEYKSALETKLKQHHKKVHGVKTISCTYENCKRMFVQECDLKEHIQRTHPQGLFNCPICDKLFVNDHKLKRHVKMHNLDTDGIACSSCHLRFLTKQKLREHMNSHTGQTPFSCPGIGCEKAFMSSSSLSHHKKVCPGIIK